MAIGTTTRPPVPSNASSIVTQMPSLSSGEISAPRLIVCHAEISSPLAITVPAPAVSTTGSVSLTSRSPPRRR